MLHASIVYRSFVVCVHGFPKLCAFVYALML